MRTNRARLHPVLARVPARTLLVLSALPMLGPGCRQDRQLTTFYFNSVAVTAGDFDNVAEPLDRMVVEHETFEGIISTATWDEDYEPDAVALKVEDLFGDGETLARYGVTFVASGTRGLGLRRYNGLEPDSALLEEPSVVSNVQRYVLHGGVLVVTDWAYDLVEKAWPDMIDFVGEESLYDAAQCGEIGHISGTIPDEALADDLGMGELAIWFDYSNWAVIDTVDEEVVTVHAVADVYYQPQVDGSVQSKAATPVLVSFQPEEATGKVVFSSFHIDAQNDAVIDEIIRSVVGTFEEHAGETEQF